MNRPNSDYWRMRFKQLETLTFNKSKNFAENLEKIFVDASEEIDFALFKFFRQFAELEHTNVREAHRILNSEELKAFRMTLEEYIKFGQEQNEFYRPEINKVLEQASLKVRVTRLEALEMELSAIVAKMLSNEHQSVYEHLADTYIDRYYRSIFTVYKGFGVGQSFAMIDERRLKDLLETPWTTDGMDFSTRIWNNQVKMTGTLKQVLGSAIARGEGYDETSQKFAKLMNTSFTNASRVIRTESAYFASRAQTDSFKELGCEKYEIVATLDDDTDEECQQLDGKVYDVKYFEAGVTAPPFHPNCVLPETVIISPDCEALTKSYYSGDVIKITVSNGTSLSVTPNHIVLTSRGWVRAKNLIKGDKIVYYSGWDKFIVESNPTKNNRVPTIEDLFTTIVKTLSGGTISMPATAIDFKGDVIENSKIDIVFIDSFLRNKFNTSISKFLSDSPLIRTSKISEDSFFSNCSLAQFLVGIGLTSDGIMSGSRIASILLRGTLTHHELVSFRLPSDYDMRLIKTTPNNTTTNREFFSKRIFANTRFVKDSNFINRHIFPSISRTSKCNSVFDQNLTDSFSSTAEELSKFAKSFPGIIEFDDVIDIDRFNYSGHVYDASSLSTLYICNGIITSNCRCATSPHLDYDFMPVGTRTARDGDGKTYRVPRNMTYPEWKKKYGNKQSNKEKLKLNKPINSKSNSNKQNWESFDLKHKESIKQFKSNSNNLTLTTKGNLTTSTGLITDSDKEIEKINYTSKIGLKDDKIKNYIKDSLSSGKLKNSINRQKQEIHVKNSPNFIEGRSYFNNDFEELEELLSEVVGTGDVLTDNKGNPINKERIDDIRFKGVYKPKYESIEKDSHKIIICHSKTGYHAYPVRPD